MQTLTGSEPRILAIDPAAACGFAHSNGQHGVWRLSTVDGNRLVNLADHIADAYEAWGFDLVAFEDAGFGAGARQLHTMALHNELRGIIKAAAVRVGAKFHACMPATIKSFATGNGRAKKHEMIRACKIKLGITTSDDNVADALWILAFAKAGFPQLATKAKKAKRSVRRRRKADDQVKMF